MTKRRLGRQYAIAAIVIATSLYPHTHSVSLANDNRIAFRLLEEGRPAQAAELFTDPAWKGVALFRSDQWWRAAEAFVRANDTDSLYNLGNAYVKLGYHALALEAYLTALAIRPDHDDARFNADLIRQFLAARDDNKGEAALTPKAREIDRLKEEKDEREGSEAADGDEQTGQNADADKTRKDKTTRAQEEQAGNSASSGGDNASRDVQRQQNETTENRVSGRSTDREQDTQVAGGSRSSEEGSGDPTTGKRIKLEKNQATRQWLNSIRDNPEQFLQRRIALEMSRRKAAGTLPAPANSPW